MKMRFLLSIDTEAEFWKYIPHPFYSQSLLYRIKWYLNRVRGKFIYAKDKQGLVNIVNFLKANKFPATFNITGHLYLKSCKGWPHFKELKPLAKWSFKKDWYYWDPASNQDSSPGLYAGSYIEKTMKSNSLFDLGLHSFAHECWPLEDKKIVNSGVKAAILAAKSIGIKPLSFSAPFNITEDKKNSEVLYTSLKENGLKIVRYAGREEFPNKSLHKFKVVSPIRKKGLIFVHTSYTFDGTSKNERIQRIIQDIKEKAETSDKNAVYCLCCHDFTFKKIDYLEQIIKTVLELKKQGKIKLINARDLLKTH